MADVLLKAENLTASYGQIEVLHGISFEVFDNEIAVILGANGAGKTTTIRALSGMVETTGTITFKREDISQLESDAIVRKGVAHVPQGRGTFPELTVEDNLRVGAFIRSDNEVQNDIQNCYDTYPVLFERRTQTAGSLSGGEQQMLAVSRALMSRPELLLLDEPSLGLAPQIVEALFERFLIMNKDHGTTMLIVEQNAQLALGMADRGYVLEAGEIVIEGAAESLINDEAIIRAYLGG
ncbi:MAG: ABC transporter ATP-binding protein [Acidimicrobiales bacterium]|jgi:branched-chain amino acid transport system ATP-binding protein|nr:ABC transporter ATP-binding protein [Acidimicrobiaceae bacterium]MDP6341487.1 ABC transporter ATP-binding protein [Acidimicrobiales bacterium]MEC7714559.1 ABC transporter ATP-binding protein [Actinomycetota bacterium]|tara:strand:+ start:944 stop:1657 length:714 start_codon:yes stop_codon:yes gene_type:complete